MPKNRITPKEALDDIYFWSADVKPCEAKNLPLPKEDVHEYQVGKVSASTGKQAE